VTSVNQLADGERMPDMSDSDQVSGEAAGQPLAAGAVPDAVALDLALFRWDLIRDQWWWSTAMWRLHGYNPGELAPSLALLLQQTHPNDHARTRQAFQRLLIDGRSFVFEHRILTATGRLRAIILAVTATRRFGQLGHINRTAVDVSEARRIHHTAQTETVAGLQAEVASLTGSLASDVIVNQAIGVLMERHHLTAADADGLIRAASQTAGRKLRDVASELLYTGRLAGYPRPPLSTRHQPKNVDT
jgi:hypothetical protein